MQAKLFEEKVFDVACSHALREVHRPGNQRATLSHSRTSRSMAKVVGTYTVSSSGRVLGVPSVRSCGAAAPAASLSAAAADRG